MFSLKGVVDRLFYNPSGQMIISAIFGLALALMFHRVCKDNCTVYYAPHIQDIENKEFKLEDTCYKYKPTSVKCNPKDKPLEDYDDSMKPTNTLKEQTMLDKFFKIGQDKSV